MGSLEHRPERLDALRSRVAPHILALRVVDALVIVEDQPEPGRVLVGVDLGVGDDPVLDEALERPAVHALDHGRAHLVGPSIPRAGDDGLAREGTGALHRLAPGLRHVLALGADIGLVGLDRTGEPIADLLPRLANDARDTTRTSGRCPGRGGASSTKPPPGSSPQIDRTSHVSIAERRPCITVPSIEREHRRFGQSRHRCGMVGCAMRIYIASVPQCGQYCRHPASATP